MASSTLTLTLSLDVQVVDDELLARVAPPAVATSSGGLAAPDDTMRVASVLGIVLTGLRDDIRAAAGIDIVGIAAEGVGLPSADAG